MLTTKKLLHKAASSGQSSSAIFTHSSRDGKYLG
jgi:hypothetical protein